jgi:hypothetical protein
MPSPFPGMDPYLENADIFSDFHDSFVTYLRESLQPQLPEPYYAAIGRLAWIEVSEPLMIHVPHDERIEPLVEIYLGRGSARRLVTTIEVLSLTNKTPGERGRDLYLRKQREILDSQVHLVEIDLLRGGHHTTAVPLERLTTAAGAFDYHVSIHHFDNLEDYFVYPFRLPDPLPRIAIPLLPGDPPVSLDLPAVLDRTYDASPYRREIDYGSAPPAPSLSADMLSWVAETAKQRAGSR